MKQRPAQYYRERAQQARTIAKSMQDDNCCRTWFNIAAGFEDLAAHIERTGSGLEKQAVNALRIQGDAVLDPVLRRRLLAS